MSRSIQTAVLLLLAGMAVSQTGPVGASTVEITANLIPTQVQAGSSVVLEVRARSTAQDANGDPIALACVFVDLGFDASVFQVASVTVGPSLTDVPPESGTVDNVGGLIHVVGGCKLTGVGAAPGSVLVASVSLNIVGNAGDTGNISLGSTGDAGFCISLVGTSCVGDVSFESLSVSVCSAVETTCSDGVDDDCDLATDCNDPDCSSDPACLCPPMPGDLNGNFDMEPGEMSGYGTCFLRACTDWAGGGPLPPPPGHVSRAGTLFLRGGFDQVDYCCDLSQAPPLLWVEPDDCTPEPAVASAKNLDAFEASLAMREIRQRDASVDVHIRIRPPSDSSAYALEETVPMGLTARAVSHGGMYNGDHGAIRWGPFLDHEPRDLSYELTAEDGHRPVGSLDGVVAFDGHETPIRGQTTIATLRGDADHDGDVDLADFLAMIECFFGTETSIAPGRDVFDFDDDSDVDLADLVSFQGLSAGNE